MVQIWMEALVCSVRIGFCPVPVSSRRAAAFPFPTRDGGDCAVVPRPTVWTVYSVSINIVQVLYSAAVDDEAARFIDDDAPHKD
jgi:hypothetical protein